MISRNRKGTIAKNNEAIFNFVKKCSKSGTDVTTELVANKFNINHSTAFHRLNDILKRGLIMKEIINLRSIVWRLI